MKNRKRKGYHITYEINEDGVVYGNLACELIVLTYISMIPSL